MDPRQSLPLVIIELPFPHSFGHSQPPETTTPATVGPWPECRSQQRRTRSDAALVRAPARAFARTDAPESAVSTCRPAVSFRTPCYAVDHRVAIASVMTRSISVSVGCRTIRSACSSVARARSWSP
jgi:hypothetical protein